MINSNIITQRLHALGYQASCKLDLDQLENVTQIDRHIFCTEIVSPKSNQYSKLISNRSILGNDNVYNIYFNQGTDTDLVDALSD
ncbi:unnamed protein product [Ambrosiozyma monospora]|uniref:Unnamed protein product n=1 Tax=Ambrosiozyma monospora TaxID=43982 RepID=A0A9W6YW39_AMBMO|nr:unnamed protein product [Ambrosiozyma monospora]